MLCYIVNAFKVKDKKTAKVLETAVRIVMGKVLELTAHLKKNSLAANESLVVSRLDLRSIN
jgi:hypothetical protein